MPAIENESRFFSPAKSAGLQNDIFLNFQQPFRVLKEELSDVEIIVNGESRQVSPAISLRQLLRSLDLQEDRVAVELNREIVRRDRWGETELHDQDRLELVHFVGGG